MRARRSCAAEALRVFMARSCCAGAKVGTTVAAPSGLGSSSVCVPFLDTKMHRSTCRIRQACQEDGCTLYVSQALQQLYIHLSASVDGISSCYLSQTRTDSHGQQSVVLQSRMGPGSFQEGKLRGLSPCMSSPHWLCPKPWTGWSSWGRSCTPSVGPAAG